MRYWPLTAVLLAFWLGRETGAADDENEVVVDTIRAKRIFVDGPGGERTFIGPACVMVEDRRAKNEVVVTPRDIEVLHDEKPGINLGLASDSKSGVIGVLDPRSKRRSSLSSGGVTLFDEAGRLRLQVHTSAKETFLAMGTAHDKELIRIEQSLDKAEIRCTDEKGANSAALTPEGVEGAR